MKRAIPGPEVPAHTFLSAPFDLSSRHDDSRTGLSRKKGAKTGFPGKASSIIRRAVSKPIEGETNIHRTQSLTKYLLYCGILSALLYLGTDIIACYRWTEYSARAQVVSELIAIDAPTRPFVVPLFVVYALLVYAFGYGIWRSAGTSRALRVAALLIVCKEILGVAITLWFPIHMRGMGETISDTMHGVLTMVGVFLCMFPAMGFAAAAFGRAFRIYSIATMALFVTCALLTGSQAAQLAANGPTPWLGLSERINIYAYMVWMCVLAVVMLKREKHVRSLRDTA